MDSSRLAYWQVGRSGAARRGGRLAANATHIIFALTCFLLLGAVFRAAEEPEEWRNQLTRAEAALRSGDRHAARTLYAHAGRMAIWSNDGFGALAAACGMRRVESSGAEYFATRRMLIRAMIVAEKQRDALALDSIAEAFSAIGEHQAAVMVRNRIPAGAQKNHPRSVSSLHTRCEYTAG